MMPATCPASESTKTFSLELKFCSPRKLSFQDAIWSVSQLIAKTGTSISTAPIFLSKIINSFFAN